eukprot:TRINITY_DN17591_c0_g1_i1.p1 TRINITY_DN17591_c0_g1~~TRINITY_DN17591_c0_g1_i1.p1  ORF type:complete len:420 (+),score=63.42 TRINITY_DN17591_c0_g1_i1:191-1450(+)
MPNVSVAPHGATDDFVTVHLHKRETSGSGYWGHPGICTVTFCEGDGAVAYSALKQKVRAVMDANPWIAGRFVKKTLVHPKTGSDALVDELVSITKSASVSRSMPYDKLVKATGANPELAVQKAGALQATNALVTKLSVVEPEQPGGEFAIIFSMSHAMADGHDYYRIANMIMGNGVIESMIAERVVEYETCEPEWTGAKDFAWISGGGGLIKGMLGGLLFGPKSQWSCYMVDQDKVASEKERAAKEGSVPFVSTHDVLTSHFCKAARARVAMVVVNFRDKIRLALKTGRNAGCYEGCLLLDPTNYETPAAIRKCLSAGVPYTRATPSPPLPGLCSSNPMALITSWASFPFDGVAVDGVTRQLLHLPCMAMPDMMDVCIVFKPQPGKLAMLCLAKRAKPHTLKAEGSPLGSIVDEGIFAP